MPSCLAMPAGSMSSGNSSGIKRLVFGVESRGRREDERLALLHARPMIYKPNKLDDRSVSCRLHIMNIDFQHTSIL